MSHRATVRVTVTSTDDGWQVTYLDADDGELAPLRQLKRCGSAPWTFPQPPPDEIAALDAAAHHHALCHAVDEEPLIDALASLMGREPGSKALLPVGRFLFAVLLGDAWPSLRRSALRLELQWNASDAAFGRFPWEMLHDGEGFLALRDSTTILRRIPGPATTMATATTPLDVLFVVGSALRDDVIRPAAEYLSLTQNLKALGLDRQLRPRLLLEASTDSLAAALAERRPAVVHVITHGRYEADRPYVELRSKSGHGVDKVFATNFVELLKDGDHPLPVVVLSACETGVARESARQGEAAAPYAAELVDGGIPLVVGMTGPVGDLACRLFARAFYSALLSGNDAAEATAAGRRAAVQHGGYDPLSAYDWALPTLFLSSALAEVRLEVSEAPLADQRRRLSRSLHKDRYPAFCDRLPILSAGETLLANATTQRRLWRQEQFVLALVTAKDTHTDKGAERFGRTRVLKALAARTALAGHVPCLVSADFWKVEPPLDWPSFKNLLELALGHTAHQLGITGYRPCEHLGFVLGGPRPDTLSSELDHLPAPHPTPQPHDLARALRQDLLRLLQAVRAKATPAKPSHCRLLLLVDDLHRMGDFADLFLDYALGHVGMDLCKDDIRVAFTWAHLGQANQTTIDKIRTWLGENQAQEMKLGRFESLEERLAYQHHLFNYQQQGQDKSFALALETSLNRPFISAFFAKLAERVRGVPSRLKQAEDVIDIYLDLPVDVLVEARDEDVMQLWLDAGGPAP